MLDKYDLFIALMIVGLASFAFVLSNFAHATTQSDIDDLQKQLVQLKTKLAQIIDLTNQQQFQMKQLEDDVKIKNEQYQDTIAKSKSSWAAIQEIDAKKAAANKAKLDFDSGTTRLNVLKEEAKNLKQSILMLDQQLNQTKIQFNNETQTIEKEKTKQEKEKTTPKRKAIGVFLSNSCRMIQDCVKYKDLLYLDNSIKKYSGDFKKCCNGLDIERDYSKYQNSFKYYDFDSTPRIFIDPPETFRSKIPIIEIYPTLDEYHLKSQFVVKEKQTIDKKGNKIKPTQTERFFGTIRYVDSTCNNAKITSKDWKFVLLDTIQFLSYNCDPAFTKINSTIADVQNLTKHDIRETKKYKQDSLLDWIKQNCLGSRNACNNLSFDPYTIKNNIPLINNQTKHY